jgi:predicted SprT family Zn-dependent metalloprotease
MESCAGYRKRGEHFGVDYMSLSLYIDFNILLAPRFLA